jgi:threonine/homoserine/homoserine lactone efflux protein
VHPLIVIVSPGTGVLFTLAAGLARSRCQCRGRVQLHAFVPHIAAAVLGLAAVLHTSAVVFETLKVLGVAAYLHGLDDAAGARNAEGGGTREIGARCHRLGDPRQYSESEALDLLSRLLPQFVSSNEGYPLPRMLDLSGVFMLLTFVVFVGYGLFAAAVRVHVISRPRVLAWMRRAFAGAFVLLGVKLALAER